MDVSNVTTNKHGEPTVTITLTGYHEIYRFAHHMETGQRKFARAGNKIIHRLRFRLTADLWDRARHGQTQTDRVRQALEAT